MLRSRLLAAVCAVLVAAPAWAQEPPPQAAVQAPPNVPEAVAVAPLAAPDFFSAAGRDTGLGADLWRGTSPALVRAVLPLLSSRPLSPAARALARRVLATGAALGEDAGRDPVLAGRRISALIAQGGVREASEILSKTSGLDRDPVLAQAAVEAALLSDDFDRACAVGDSLSTGRDEPYWLRLRAYCQLRRGDAGPAQLTFDLAQDQARDGVYGRLMGVRLAGSGDPGKASLRNGLDYALSRDLGLDLAQAAPSPAVAAALNPGGPVEATWPMPAAPGAVRATLVALASGDLATARTLRASLVQADFEAAGAFDMAMLDAALAAASGRDLGPALDALVVRGDAAEPRTRARAQAAAVLLAALGAPLADAAQAPFAAFSVGDARAPAARALLLDIAAADRRTGETALLALWIAADAGAAGPAAADRARIVRALRAAGLETDARAFALEGLLALR
ncbi:MAG TPA: hypothetical protein VFW47_11640 [Phenylobacterium sp.]|nr:hypothetical protein [Phenylobacterium sp.]